MVKNALRFEYFILGGTARACVNKEESLWRSHKSMLTHAVIFAPIGQISRSEQIIQRLSNAIVTGLLEPHEQLPNEADLAKMMGVSHITVREALNILRANNLIYTVRGRNGGSFVCENAQARGEGLHPFDTVSSDYLADLGEMHCAVISHCAGLASRRMTPCDIARFEEMVALFASARSPELKAQADLRCLLALAAHSHSSRLANQELQLQSEWAPLVADLYQSATVHQYTVDDYTALVEALRLRNADRAVQASTRLINELTACLIENKLKHNRNL